MSAVLSDKDVDSEIASDWAKIQDKYTPDELELESPPAGDANVEIDPPKETIPVSRKPDGKFKAQDDKADAKDAKPAKDSKATPAADKAPVAEPSKEDSASSTAEPSAAQRDIERPPSSWKPLVRAEWAKLPANVRAEIHRREQDFQNGQSQLLPDAQFGKSMREVIDPYRMLIESSGAPAPRVVADILRDVAILRTGTEPQKYQTVARIAQFYGIDLRRFGVQPQQQAGQQQPQPQQFRDPRVDQLLAQQQRAEQERQARETQELDSTVTRWMNEADAQGNPKRPYLNDVINEMSALVTQMKQADQTLNHSQALDKAYEAAIWAHPEIRQLLTQQQQTELDAKRRADNQTRVRDARRAGSVNVARRASTPSPGKPGSMDETLTATARELGLIT